MSDHDYPRQTIARYPRRPRKDYIGPGRDEYGRLRPTAQYHPTLGEDGVLRSSGARSASVIAHGGALSGSHNPKYFDDWFGRKATLTPRGQAGSDQGASDMAGVVGQVASRVGNSSPAPQKPAAPATAGSQGRAASGQPAQGPLSSIAAAVPFGDIARSLGRFAGKLVDGVGVTGLVRGAAARAMGAGDGPQAQGRPSSTAGTGSVGNLNSTMGRTVSEAARAVGGAANVAWKTSPQLDARARAAAMAHNAGGRLSSSSATGGFQAIMPSSLGGREVGFIANPPPMNNMGPAWAQPRGYAVGSGRVEEETPTRRQALDIAKKYGASHGGVQEYYAPGSKIPYRAETLADAVAREERLARQPQPIATTPSATPTPNTPTPAAATPAAASRPNTPAAPKTTPNASQPTDYHNVGEKLRVATDDAVDTAGGLIYDTVEAGKNLVAGFLGHKRREEPSALVSEEQRALNRQNRALLTPPPPPPQTPQQRAQEDLPATVQALPSYQAKAPQLKIPRVNLQPTRSLAREKAEWL